MGERQGKTGSTATLNRIAVIQYRMCNSSQFSHISPKEAFKRIDAGATVITPNRRLALALKAQFNSHQIQQKMSVWHTADVVPFAAFIERVYFDALFTPNTRWPFLLSPMQEQALWEEVIQSSEVGKTLLKVPQTAQLVRQAWQLMHAWHLQPHVENHDWNDDVQAFLNWGESYRTVTEQAQQLDLVRVCDYLSEHYASLDIKRISALICYGFDVFTPQQLTFFNTLVNCGCEVIISHPEIDEFRLLENAKHCEFGSYDDEIHQAAVWARSKIEQTEQAVRVGIVVPELASYRNALSRIFSAIMHPDVRTGLPGAAQPILPFNISLGVALTQYPLIDAAFVCLFLLDQEIEFARLSHWLRSPFLGGAETESDQRVLIDARIREHAEPVVAMERLWVLLHQEGGELNCPLLMERLSALAKFRQSGLPRLESHATFAKVITEVLQTIGFPGERTLNSNEYQTLKKWQALIADFASFDRVVPSTTYHDAIERLYRMANETLFQPETPEVPIQILGALEAANQEFDYVWVMGLSDKHWPLQTHPNPFLPLELQRKAKLPQASTMEALLYCRRLMQGWSAHAREAIFSYAKFSSDEDNEELNPSPLVAEIPETQLNQAVPISHRDLIIQFCDLVQAEEGDVPPLAQHIMVQGIRGGTAIIKDYAACPFRAWARHRLRIETPLLPHAGLNASERGLLVHQILAQVWRQLHTKDSFDALHDDELESLLARLAREAIAEMQRAKPLMLSGRFAEIEVRRLLMLVREWLDQERKRDSFAVVAIEEKRTLRVADLELSVRLDRVDEVEGGQRIVIDYKTSKQSIQAFIGERPDEPQLPLYLTMTEADQQAAGIAFATVKRGEMGFAAILNDSDLLPGGKAFEQINGCKQFSSWAELVAAWRQNLTNLAEGFCSGDATVNPKNFPKTCQYCEMQLFCRIHERIAGDVVAENSDND